MLQALQQCLVLTMVWLNRNTTDMCTSSLQSTSLSLLSNHRTISHYQCLPKLCINCYMALNSLPYTLSALQRLISFGENQLQDLLTLRRLFLGRLGSLLSERKHLMYQISQHRDQSDKVQYWAAELEQNIVHEQRTYLQNSTAQYLGVSISV